MIVPFYCVHFPPQIRIFSIKYIEKLEGVSVGGSGCVPGDHLYKIYWLVSPLRPLRGGGHTEDTCYSGHKWGHVTRDVITLETRHQSP